MYSVSCQSSNQSSFNVHCALRSFFFSSARGDQSISPLLYPSSSSFPHHCQLPYSSPIISARHSVETANEHKIDPRDLSITKCLPFLQGSLRKFVSWSLNKFIQSRCFLLSRCYPSPSRYPVGLRYPVRDIDIYMHGEILKCHANKRSVCPKFAHTRNIKPR